MSGKIVMGIDEAGLGPRLGPLVVSRTSFKSLPGSPCSLKAALSEVTGKTADIDGEKLRVDDSKVVYRGTLGFSYLERTVLAFQCAAFGSIPANLGEWIRNSAFPRSPDLDECPWLGSYPRSLALPHVIPKDKIEKIGLALRERLDKQRWQFLPPRQEIITAPALNRGIRRFNNKSTVLSASIASLISDAAGRIEESSLEIESDKLGGRVYYGDMIRSIFPFKEVSVERETPSLSSYSVLLDGRRIKISFLRRGDSKSLPIALASMFSKYTRELFMLLFNRYWCNLKSDLKPTAGYPLDAVRFLEEVDYIARAEGINPRVFTRIR